MCNLYSITTNQAVIIALLRALNLCDCVRARDRVPRMLNVFEN
jgi:hypothetical protein